MFKIKVSEAIIQHCQNQVELYDFGQRYTANGTKEQQLTGIIGQSVIMDIFGLPPVNGADGFDGGVDIVYNDKSIDVKTMGRTTDVREYYVNNFIGLQMYFTPDIYIFCSFNKVNKELTVCGWVTKDELQERAHFYPKGSIRTRSDGSTFKTFSDLYEISNHDLHNVQSAEELKRAMAI